MKTKKDLDYYLNLPWTYTIEKELFEGKWYYIIQVNETCKTSDIDILVDFDAKKGFFVFVELKYYLEDLLKCEVDLVSKRALHPALKKRILSEAKQIF